MVSALVRFFAPFDFEGLRAPLASLDCTLLAGPFATSARGDLHNVFIAFHVVWGQDEWLEVTRCQTQRLELLAFLLARSDIALCTDGGV